MQNCHIVAQVHTSLSSFRLSPAILIPSCRPLSFSFSQFPIEIQKKTGGRSQRRLKWFFRGSGQQPVLVSAQKIHTTKNKLISVFSSAAGRNQADGNETKSSLHRTPWNSTKRANPRSPKRESLVRAGCVCVCARAYMHAHTQTHKLPTRKTDQLVYATSLLSHTCYRQLERWYSVEVKGEASEARLHGALS